MIVYDKLEGIIGKRVLDTINLLASEGNRAQLEKWLRDCENEIALRAQEKMDGLYELTIEKRYLEYILN